MGAFPSSSDAQAVPSFHHRSHHETAGAAPESQFRPPPVSRLVSIEIVVRLVDPVPSPPERILRDSTGRGELWRRGGERDGHGALPHQKGHRPSTTSSRLSSEASADLMFGGITIVCGILGTLSGGIILDKIGATIPNAFK
ncbi:uncharacterized protein LOC111258325 [Setaria italica]|uniref:uncharacterized protein LOC111258325 n=1 Tax=Setaria italica TaxID=4555 RepID=UPI000BE5F915|nr:uncharacterized protein LOC111258325 [Setaria italica]